MSFKRPTPLEMAYIDLCGCHCLIKFQDASGLVKVCTGKDPFIRMRKEFPVKYFDTFVQQVAWVADARSAKKIMESRYMQVFGLDASASKEGIRTIDHEVMVDMAARVVAIAREELVEMKKTKSYRKQRRAEKEAIMADRILGLKSRTMRDFDDRIIKKIIGQKLREGE